MSSDSDYIVESKPDYSKNIQIKKIIDGKEVIVNYENLFIRLGGGGYGEVYKFKKDN